MSRSARLSILALGLSLVVASTALAGTAAPPAGAAAAGHAA